MKNRLILGAGNFQQGTEKYLLYLKYYIDLLEKAYGLMNLKSMQNKRITKVVRTKKRYTRNTKYHKTKQNSLDPSTSAYKQHLSRQAGLIPAHSPFLPQH